MILRTRASRPATFDARRAQTRQKDCRHNLAWRAIRSAALAALAVAIAPWPAAAQSPTGMLSLMADSMPAITPRPAAAGRAPYIRLYALDCGRIEIADMDAFADGGQYAGRPGVLPSPCFLIRHPDGDLIWDTGIGDQFAGARGVTLLPGYQAFVTTTLKAQLSQLGLSPDKVRYLAFSHEHVDHIGNANLFAKATWLLNKKEHDWVLATATPAGRLPALLAASATARRRTITSDFDVFGDHSVMILQAPGHTPGHQVLLVRLPRSGPVILAGDLYHSLENRAKRRVPRFNTDRAQTLASMDRIEGLARRLHARLVIQHAAEDIGRLPAFPRPLD
jgi:glyoxylase-like metal-dependent hydrolase (beta-lactamase superfamily II)